MSWYLFESCGKCQILFDGVVLVFVLKYIFLVHKNMDEVSVDPEQPESETAEAHYIWQ